jgi:hypothetical protein
MKTLLLTAGLLLALHPARCQAVAADTLAWFDFWVGDWDLEWTDARGAKQTGRNHIEKIMGGTVLSENFLATSGPTQGYEGKSYSIFQRGERKWRQTWVDNEGAYLSFEGGREGDDFFFEDQRTLPDGQTQRARMVFHDISPDGFVWDWKSSLDGGRTWQLNWQIRYRRRPER